jgi:hypothetical protein
MPETVHVIAVEVKEFPWRGRWFSSLPRTLEIAEYSAEEKARIELAHSVESNLSTPEQVAEIRNARRWLSSLDKISPADMAELADSYEARPYPQGRLVIVGELPPSVATARESRLAAQAVARKARKGKVEADGIERAKRTARRS